MMRNVFAALAIAAAFLAGGRALAVPQNGVLSGLNVVWTAAGAAKVQPGEGYVAGNLYLGNQGFTPLTVNNIQHGQVLTPNTPYYEYACFDTQDAGVGMLSTPVTSATAPKDDGTQVGILTSWGDACDAVFLGSVVADSTASLVPFVRSGEDVILALVNNPANPCTALGVPAWYQGAGAVPLTFTSPGCQLVTFDSLNDKSCNGHDSAANELDLPVPRSASAMLVDWLMENTDDIAHYVDVPYSTLPNPTPAQYLSNYQLNLFWPTDYNDNFTDHYSHTRVNPSFDAGVNTGHTPPAPAVSAQFMVCIDGAFNTGDLTGYVIYRGYVESIGHLTQE